MREIKNRKEFKELVKNHQHILIDFYADWCGPCKSLLPIVNKLAVKYKGEMEIVKINVDKNQALAKKFNVRSIPALFFMEDKIVKESLLGLQTSSKLESMIKNYTALETKI